MQATAAGASWTSSERRDQKIHSQAARPGRHRASGPGRSSLSFCLGRTARHFAARRQGQRSTAAAKKPRSNHEPTVVPASVHRIDPSLISKNAVRVTDTLQQAGFRAFIVGGAVRDLLFGIAPKDFDVATDATPTEVQRLFRRARLIGRRFQIVHVQFGQELIEVSTFRALVDAPPRPRRPSRRSA
jgi:hypothetical protein